MQYSLRYNDIVISLSLSALTETVSTSAGALLLFNNIVRQVTHHLPEGTAPHRPASSATGEDRRESTTRPGQY